MNKGLFALVGAALVMAMAGCAAETSDAPPGDNGGLPAPQGGDPVASKNGTLPGAPALAESPAERVNLARRLDDSPVARERGLEDRKIGRHLGRAGLGVEQLPERDAFPW
jgi:hypothetical protein